METREIIWGIVLGVAALFVYDWLRRQMARSTSTTRTAIVSNDTRESDVWLEPYFPKFPVAGGGPVFATPERCGSSCGG